LLNERRAFQAEPGAVGENGRRMVMPDNLDPARGLHRAMAMMKVETLGLKRVDHLNLAAQLAIVITCDNYDFTALPEVAEQPRRFARRGFVVHQVAENDQSRRIIFGGEFPQSLRDGRHPPKRHQRSSGSLT
jgi:hypothetical protein